MFCPRCKTELREDMKFCPECGMKIEKCPVCQGVIMQGGTFCSHCGNPLNKEVQSQLDGYYQPLHETFQQEDTQDISFQDVSVNKKVNKKLIFFVTSLVAVLMIGSYFYLYHGPQVLPNNQPEPELELEPMQIGSTTSAASFIGNMNQGSEVYQDNDNIYMCDDHGYLVSMDRELKNRQTLVNEKCDNIQVADDVIYYTNEKHQICQISKDGKDKKVLLNQDVYYLNYKNEKLYYQLDGNGKENIYVYDLKTNKQTQLNHRKSYHINVLDDCLYYTSTDGLYKIGLDGQGEEKIIEGTVYNLIYQNGKLYYSLNNQVMSFDIKTQKTDRVIDEMSQLLNMNENELFYFSKSGVKKYDFQSKQITNIYAGNIETLFIVGDKIVLQTKSSYDEESYKVIMDMNGENQQRLFASQEGDFI